MIDEKFSAESFAKLGLDSDQSRELADQLQREVSEEMQQVIEEKFKEIVEKLNSLGHNLRFKQDSSTGEISFRDDYVNGDYYCKLRLAFDYVTSAGYPDLINPNDEDIQKR